MRALGRANPRTLFLVLVLAAILALFAWVAFRSGPLAPVRVTVGTTEERTVAPALFGIGTIEARYSHKVGPIGPGRVSAIFVDVGDRVGPGQILATIDPIDLDQRIIAAGEGVSRAASLEELAAAQITDAAARLELARAEARRSEELLRSGWTTRAAVDQRRQALAAAQAGLSSAKANRRAAEQERRRSRADRAALIEQRSNLRLTSPRSGLVVKRLAEPGTTVVAGQAVIETADPTRYWVNARFDQTRSAGITDGLPAQVRFRSSADRSVNGTVLRVEPVADPATEEVLAKVGFATSAVTPALGELAEVTVSLPARGRGLAIPNAALHRLDGVLGVWAIRSGKIRFVPVRVGPPDTGGWVQALAGLKQGDRFVLHSARTLDADTRVEVVERLP